MRDDLFNNNVDIADFRFDKKVVKVFDDMVRRSVPGYDSMIQMVGLVARMYGQDNTNYYDLGASTGAISLAISLNNKHKNNQFIAIDNSAEMVKKCQANLEKEIENLKVLCADINDTDISNASIVVLNLTLQFIDVDARLALLKKIYNGLNPGGVLIISEKIHFDDTETQNHITKLHIDFKRENGYSELEIANKRQAIENVMITETKKTHITRLKDCGFIEASCYFQCLNFVSFLSVK
tara:strand:+ start:4023 stop:4736 length:714 start_codon:yes stop_codon:yes gene_type:complete